MKNIQRILGHEIDTEVISKETAYELICTKNNDIGGRDSISARGWLKHSSYYGDKMTLTDGSVIIRDWDYNLIRYHY